MAKTGGWAGFTLIELMVWAIAILMLVDGGVGGAHGEIGDQAAKKSAKLRGDLREMAGRNWTAIRTLRTGCCCGEKGDDSGISPSRSMCW